MKFLTRRSVRKNSSGDSSTYLKIPDNLKCLCSPLVPHLWRFPVLMDSCHFSRYWCNDVKCFLDFASLYHPLSPKFGYIADGGRTAGTKAAEVAGSCFTSFSVRIYTPAWRRKPPTTESWDPCFLSNGTKAENIDYPMYRCFVCKLLGRGHFHSHVSLNSTASNLDGIVLAKNAQQKGNREPRKYPRKKTERVELGTSFFQSTLLITRPLRSVCCFIMPQVLLTLSFVQLQWGNK